MTYANQQKKKEKKKFIFWHIEIYRAYKNRLTYAADFLISNLSVKYPLDIIWNDNDHWPLGNDLKISYARDYGI